ncbi:hypothetical protein FLA105534_03467 [Flavobacterium bizetiae]|uniref:Uncharacterized protein n=1 Tax=Flavobacterium bizetiae TaxID=2704140 RepID=A0A6J4GT63_9FLAO|nr:hypothetical protein [Flavobacterium bizetiae]CAA9201215.1 hypothetical protein FLA105534_03467 [Flavobacterium bizetiae]CAD5340480.1 hypothetical protein FLA105535_00434 [Flavobacterium bizetiae]CAD5346883.1 hypothetical protein FLA105534_00826 [Flavobacterium bizetiae]
MDFTPKDLGETPKTPDMSNFKNPLGQTTEGNIFIESFTITPLTVSEKKENLSEIIRKESRDGSM